MTETLGVPGSANGSNGTTKARKTKSVASGTSGAGGQGLSLQRLYTTADGLQRFALRVPHPRRPGAGPGLPILRSRRQGQSLRQRVPVHDLPLSSRREPTQLPSEDHFQDLAPTVGVHFDHQAFAELRMAKPLPDLIARLGHFHSSNSSPRSGMSTCAPTRSRSLSRSGSAASSSP